MKCPFKGLAKRRNQADLPDEDLALFLSIWVSTCSPHASSICAIVLQVHAHLCRYMHNSRFNRGGDLVGATKHARCRPRREKCSRSQGPDFPKSGDCDTDSLEASDNVLVVYRRRCSYLDFPSVASDIVLSRH